MIYLAKPTYNRAVKSRLENVNTVILLHKGYFKVLLL